MWNTTEIWKFLSNIPLSKGSLLFQCPEETYPSGKCSAIVVQWRSLLVEILLNISNYTSILGSSQTLCHSGNLVDMLSIVLLAVYHDFHEKPLRYTKDPFGICSAQNSCAFNDRWHAAYFRNGVKRIRTRINHKHRPLHNYERVIVVCFRLQNYGTFLLTHREW